MSSPDFKKIMARIDDHEHRICALEADKKIPLEISSSIKKQITFAELIKGRKFKSGQEKITIIVGFYEKILKKFPIKEDEIKAGWVKGKFDGKYRSNLLERAIKDGLIRDLENKTFDLSQVGEKFFENFLKSNVGVNQTGAKK